LILNRKSGCHAMRSGMFSPRVIFLQVLVVVAALIFLEGAARVAFTIHSNLRKPSEWYTYTAEEGWGRRPNFNGRDDCGIHRSFDQRGLLSSDAARLQTPASNFRALFLGDSNVYGFCLETRHTFVEVANRAIPQLAAINLGVNGYTSFQGYKSLLKYGDQLKPDILFVSFNFNDRRMVLQEAQADSDAVFRRLNWSRFARHLSDWSYLFRAVDALGRRLAGDNPAESAVTSDVQLDKVSPRVSPQSYRENLTRMAQWAKQRGIPIAFILLRDSPNETSLLRQGLQYLADKDYDRAIEQLKLAKDRPRSWHVGLAGLHLSQAYAGIGRMDEARRALALKDALVSIHGGYPIRLDSDYNAIMREVADKFGAQLIDAAAELDKRPGTYFDFCHFDKQGHAVVGALVAGAIAAAKSGSVAITR
jgi:lysophospholipase L1-like esterase